MSIGICAHPCAEKEQIFMEDDIILSKVAMYVNRGCLVVPIQVELYDESVLQIQEDILKKVSKTRVKGVIIDLSGVTIIDSYLGGAIFDTAGMASLLGAKTVITGLRAGVVASLIDLDFNPGDVLTAVSLEEGLQMLETVVGPEEEPEETEAGTDEDVTEDDADVFADTTE